jgi:hypothetical protein
LTPTLDEPLKQAAARTEALSDAMLAGLATDKKK